MQQKMKLQYNNLYNNINEGIDANNNSDSFLAKIFCCCSYAILHQFMNIQNIVVA